MSISKEEVNLYDRQIRLWGMDAQKKIKEGRVLVVADRISTTLQELCKNLTLSGFGSIHVVCMNNDASDYALLYSDLQTSLMEINGKLAFALTVRPDPLEELNALTAVDFLVIIGNLDRSLLVSLNEAARSRGICTSWSMSRGNRCYLLNDFITFEWASSNGSGSATTHFPSFKEVFERDLAKSHRNALIRAFSENAECSSSREERRKPATAIVFNVSAPYRIAGAAVIGALLNQEIIKHFSRKDAPITNFIALDTFNLNNSTATL